MRKLDFISLPHPSRCNALGYPQHLTEMIIKDRNENIFSEK
jgi:hypothetical protein